MAFKPGEWIIMTEKELELIKIFADKTDDLKKYTRPFQMKENKKYADVEDSMEEILENLEKEKGDPLRHVSLFRRATEEEIEKEKLLEIFDPIQRE